jgi:riboflavin biosynthesis pyrimidine reductase
MERPYIICHMMTSLDGKITFGTVQGKDVEIPLFSDYMDLYNSTHEKLNSTAWMCGRVTMDEFDKEEHVPLDAFQNATDEVYKEFIFKNDLNNYAIGIDTKGLLRWNENFLYIGNEKIDANKFNLVMIVSYETPKEYLAYLRSKNISYIFGGDRDIDFQSTFKQLKEKFNIERILLEGGGSINGSVISEDLIDEISLLLIPVVVNNVEAPELFYKELSVPKLYNFKLESFERMEKDVMWMRYLKG